MKRCGAAAAAVLGALAIAGPIADAGAATTPGTFPWSPPGTVSSSPPGTVPWPPPTGASPWVPPTGDLTSLLGFYGVPPSFINPGAGGGNVTKGPTVVNSIFKGTTVVQVHNGTADSSIGASP